MRLSLKISTRLVGVAVDLDFFFDPVCPWAWITSRWVTEVAEQTDYQIEWRFISLKIINEDRDYGTDFPTYYPTVHGLGFSLLRICAAARKSGGNQAVASLYTELGNRIHTGGLSKKIAADSGLDVALLRSSLISEAIAASGLDPKLAAAGEDESYDELIRTETETALTRTGKDVGTPILTFAPGTDTENSLFGPVIATIPRGAQAVELWDAVRTMAAVPGFAELKRSLRAAPSFE